MKAKEQTRWWLRHADESTTRRAMSSSESAVEKSSSGPEICFDREISFNWNHETISDLTWSGNRCVISLQTHVSAFLLYDQHSDKASKRDGKSAVFWKFSNHLQKLCILALISISHGYWSFLFIVCKAFWILMYGLNGPHNTAFVIQRRSKV